MNAARRNAPCRSARPRRTLAHAGQRGAAEQDVDEHGAVPPRRGRRWSRARAAPASTARRCRRAPAGRDSRPLRSRTGIFGLRQRAGPRLALVGIRRRRARRRGLGERRRVELGGGEEQLRQSTPRRRRGRRRFDLRRRRLEAQQPALRVEDAWSSCRCNCSGGSPRLTGSPLFDGSSGRGLVRYQKRSAAGRPDGKRGPSRRAAVAVPPPTAGTRRRR